MSNFTLRELFIEELQDLYSAEQQLLNALPKMAGAATNEDLRDAFQSHLDETRTQVGRLEDIFRTMNVPARAETCEAMKGLIKEGEEAIECSADLTVRDVGLIAAAQRVEHYEIAVYGTLIALVDHLDEDSKVKDLLKETIDEEGAADKKLTKLAEGGWIRNGINKEAATV